MELNLIIAILGIISTIFLGILSIRYAIKFKKSTKLSYVQESCIPLFRSIVQNLDGIKITYENKPITPSLLLLKGSFINTGNSDIDNTIIHQPLTVELSDNYKWLKSKVVKTSTNVSVTSKIIDDQKLMLEWDLLKKNEFFSFDALIQGNSEENNKEIKKSSEEKEIVKKLNNTMSFNHRITNLGEIEKDKLMNFSRSKKRHKIMLSFLIIYILLGITLIIVPFLESKQDIHYIINNDENKNIEVKLIPQKDNKIKIEGVNSDFTGCIAANELVDKYKLTPKIVKSKYNYYLGIIAGSIIALICSFILFGVLYIYHRDKKLIKLLQISSQ